jgi:hypothetical protein
MIYREYCGFYNSEVNCYSYKAMKVMFSLQPPKNSIPTPWKAHYRALIPRHQPDIGCIEQVMCFYSQWDNAKVTQCSEDVEVEHGDRDQTPWMVKKDDCKTRGKTVGQMQCEPRSQLIFPTWQSKAKHSLLTFWPCNAFQDLILDTLVFGGCKKKTWVGVVWFLRL